MRVRWVSWWARWWALSCILCWSAGSSPKCLCALTRWFRGIEQVEFVGIGNGNTGDGDRNIVFTDTGTEEGSVESTGNVDHKAGISSVAEVDGTVVSSTENDFSIFTAESDVTDIGRVDNDGVGTLEQGDIFGKSIVAIVILFEIFDDAIDFDRTGDADGDAAFDEIAIGIDLGVFNAHDLFALFDLIHGAGAVFIVIEQPLWEPSFAMPI